MTVNAFLYIFSKSFYNKVNHEQKLMMKFERDVFFALYPVYIL